MLKIHIKPEEYWDENNEEFVYLDAQVLELEHSLVALSKWEQEWEKPFLGPGERTVEETLGYIEAMVMTADYAPEVLQRLTQENLDAIIAYIDKKSTATFFNESVPGHLNRQIVTSELIYSWMNAFQIDKECEHWHLSRLFTLIRIHNVQNSPKKKVNRADQLNEMRRLNEQRQQETGLDG